MGAQLKSTVFVKDPDTRRPVRLEPGTLPEPRYAALVTNPAAWVDGKLPRLPKAKTDDGAGEGGSPSGGGQDAAPGAASASADADPQPDPQPAQGDGTDGDKPATRKTTAARKTAARKPAAD